MAAEFIVLLGDNPHRLDTETPYFGGFAFDQDLPPNTSKPSVLMVSVQGLIEPTNVFLNNTLIGKLTPTPTLNGEDYWVAQMINLGAQGSRGPESGESVLFPKNQYMDNRLLIENVSQSFSVKNIVLHYHVEKW